MVKVAFYKGKGTIFNALVRWWTNGPYSHTEVVVHTSMYGLSLCYSSQYTDGGVRKKWRYLNGDEWDIVELDIDPKVVEDWFNQRLGAKYDLAGLLGVAFRRDRFAKNKYFCSETSAESVGIKEGWRYDPNALKPIIDRLAVALKERK